MKKNEDGASGMVVCPDRFRSVEVGKQMSNRENLSKHGAPHVAAIFLSYWRNALMLLVLGLMLGLAARAQHRVSGHSHSLASTAGIVNLAAGLGLVPGTFDPGLQLGTSRRQDTYFGTAGVADLDLSLPGQPGQRSLSGVLTQLHSGGRALPPRSHHPASRFELLAERDGPAALTEAVPGTPRPPWPFKASVSYRIRANWRF